MNIIVPRLKLELFRIRMQIAKNFPLCHKVYLFVFGRPLMFPMQIEEKSDDMTARSFSFKNFLSSISIPISVVPVHFGGRWGLKG